MAAKTLEYAVELDEGGHFTVPGGGQFVTPEGWSADHLLLAALVRCSIDSFAYHARRAGHTVAGSGSAHGTITKAGDDGRYRFVAIDVSPEALAVASANAEALGLADRVTFRQGSLLESIAAEHAIKDPETVATMSKALDRLIAKAVNVYDY